MRNLNLGPRASTLRPQHAGACHNCHAPVQEKYCGQCGQDAHVHVASAHEFIHHFIGHYVAAEGKLWATLRKLLFRPGQLTLEFIRGRRQRYIDPLRLLLTISLLAFLVMKLLPVNDPVPATPKTSAAASQARAQYEATLHPLQKLVIAGFTAYSPGYAAKYERFMALPAKDSNDLFIHIWMGKGPTIALLLIPAVALWLKLAQAGTGWRYGEHLVFAFHLLAYALCALMLAVLLSAVLEIRALWLAAIGSVPLYLLLAMRKVYGGNWLLVATRWCLVGYLCVLSLRVGVWLAVYGTIAGWPAT